MSLSPSHLYCVFLVEANSILRIEQFCRQKVDFDLYCNIFGWRERNQCIVGAKGGRPILDSLLILAQSWGWRSPAVWLHQKRHHENNYVALHSDCRLVIVSALKSSKVLTSVGLLTFVCSMLQWVYDMKITRSAFIGNSARDVNGFGGAIYAKVGLRPSVQIEGEITTEGRTCTIALKACSLFVCESFTMLYTTEWTSCQRSMSGNGSMSQNKGTSRRGEILINSTTKVLKPSNQLWRLEKGKVWRSKRPHLHPDTVGRY